MTELYAETEQALETALQQQRLALTALGRVHDLADQLAMHDPLAAGRLRAQASHAGRALQPAPVAVHSGRDPLTGLYGRAAFYEFTSHEFARVARYGRPLALLALQWRGYGAPDGPRSLAGEGALLGELALVLRELSRDVDVIARLDGARFAVLMPETDAEGARVCAERLARDVAAQGRWSRLHPALRAELDLGWSDALGALHPLDLIQRAERHLQAQASAGPHPAGVAEPGADVRT